MAKKRRTKKKAAATWKKLPFVGEMRGNPCLQCPDPRAELPPYSVVAVGFGDAHLERDGEVLWDENRDGEGLDWGDMMTCAKAEEMAAADPDHDWRIVKHGPLHGETYQRHGKGRWVCVEQNQGFA